MPDPWMVLCQSFPKRFEGITWRVLGVVAQ